jgi:hypothetical protein
MYSFSDGAPDPWKNTESRVVGVAAFSGTLRNLKSVPLSWHYLSPPTCGYRKLLGSKQDEGLFGMKEDQCKQRLLEGTQKLDPVLNPLGFVFEISESGVSSAGSFAAGFYKNGDKKIGLIYRSIAGLGAVIYEYGRMSVTHSDLMGYLGKQDASKLKYNTNRFSSYSKGGENIFDALVYDTQNFGLEFLTSSEDQFSNTLQEIAKTPESQQTSRHTQWIWVGLILLLIVLCIVIIFSQQ